MLSIGKLAAGQERYYEKQVAQGLDDYFTGRGESPGRWLGSGAGELGLRGTVEDGQVSMLMEGRNPGSGRMLREQPVKVAALDLTFSAPKSVSVLHALADERLARELVACHEEAVQAAFAYLEDTAVLVSRRTGAGLTLCDGGGFVTAAFRHRMSRALDPQLHTHCVSANLAKGPDGRWTALHHPTLFRAAQTAGYLYQAHLRALVSERLGLEWGLVRKGAAELVAIEPGVLEEFSRRRHEMRRAAEEGGIGLGSRSAAQAAALATRSRKQYGIETGTWKEEVAARAAEHGLDRAALAELESAAREALDGRGQPEVVEDGGEGERQLFDRLAGAAGLTELQNTFDQRAVLRALAEAAQQGARVGELVKRGGRFAERRDVLETTNREMTTAELVAVERRLVAAAHGRACEGVGRVDQETANRALVECRSALNQGQRKAVEATISSGHGVQVIEALAGTGKTFTAGVLRHVYQQAGYQVLGVAPTGRAVRELAEQAGIPARTLDSLLFSLERGYTLPKAGVVVLDEAGMAPTRQTAALLEAAQHAGCKVIAIGDPGQLHSVQAGGWMRAVGRRVGTLRLSEVLRQRDALERRALAALHEGKPDGWLEWARANDRIALGTGRELLDRAVAEWHGASVERGPTGTVLIARDNDTRAGLNERARTLVREQHGLGEERSYGPVQIAAGDRVICRRNDGQLDVDNGTRGTIRAVDSDGVTIETDGGTYRRLPAAYVADHLEHAYALTGHGMQGGTVETAFVVAAPHELTKGWSYTALSRARGQTRLFAITDHEQQDREELAPGERQERRSENDLYARIARYMQTRDDEELAIEQLPARSARDPELRQLATAQVVQEAASERAEPSIPERATGGAYRHACQQVEALGTQLQALQTPEVARLAATDRRERELIAHQDELLARAQQVASPAFPRTGDANVVERTNVDRALAGVSAELEALRKLRDRLVREVGELDQIRAQRPELEQSLARARSERDRIVNDLICRELQSQPIWARSALGDRPLARRDGELWDRAARGLARYRLEHDVVDQHRALGERPTDAAAGERYDHARQMLERVQRQLRATERDQPSLEPAALAPRYAGVLGEVRTARLEGAIATQLERVSELPDDQLHALAGVEQAADAGLDRDAAAKALRMEREHAQHLQISAKQKAAATELEQQASQLGWRARREREQLRHSAHLQRDHAARHVADAERIELEISRLHASGRHPDQWLHQHGDRLAAGIAATAEVERRREREIDRQAQLAAVQPPAHVIELIDDRPLSGVRLAWEWERLSERIERYALSHAIDVGQDGPLGPDPSEMPMSQRFDFERQRMQLATEVTQYRQARGLAAHKQAQDVVREQRERDRAAARELSGDGRELA